MRYNIFKQTFLVAALLTITAQAVGQTAAATTQIPIDYFYGFETSLDDEGWSFYQEWDSRSGISMDNSKSGDYSFAFSVSFEPQFDPDFDPQSVLQYKYLISPLLMGFPVTMSFGYYFERESAFSPSFWVGYSTTTNDINEFNWSKKTTYYLKISGYWYDYSANFPAGTKYVAIRYSEEYNDTETDFFSYHLYIDDISISSFAKVTDISVSNLTQHEATLSWNVPPSGEVANYVYQYRDLYDGDWSEEVTVGATVTSVTLSGLSAGTYYQFRVKPLFENVQGEYSDYTFITDCDVNSLPYTNSFEKGIGCWNQYVHNTKLEGILSSAAHTGNHSFCFYRGQGPDDPEYLISPAFEGNDPIAVSFYYTTDGRKVETFQVGYSTTNEASAFTWGETITATGTEWILYDEVMPQGTKYVAVKYLSQDQSQLFLDDFTFKVDDGCRRPKTITLDDVSCVAATLTWTVPETSQTLTGYAYQYKKASDEEWSAEAMVTGTSATLDGLSADTDYQFRVKALYGTHGESFWLPIRFTTDMELPYECGFENGMNRWGLVDIDWGFTEISPDAAHDGENGFMFDGSKHAQYLISPRFAGTSEMTVSFYYRDCNPGSNFWETFKVGYSTTTNDLDAFTWSDDFVANDIPWTKYEHTFPMGTRYIAVAFIQINSSGLYIDDFSFAEYAPYAKPSDLAVSDLTDQGAKFAWSAPDASATGYAYQYKKASDTEWSTQATVNTTSVTLGGLDANTSYQFRVKALYAGGSASNYVAVSFLTEAPAVTSLPFTEGFENGMGGWRIGNGYFDTGIYSLSTNNIHRGKYSFRFYDRGTPREQYLISPQFDVIGSIKVSFYHKIDTQSGTFYSFFVGYSTTGKDPDDFTWSRVFAGSEWQAYTTIFPEGTKYVAIKWGSVIIDNFYLDDFTFEPSSITPVELQDIEATDVAATSANIIWTGQAEKFEVNFREKARFQDDFEANIGTWTAFERTNVMFGSGAKTSWQWANPDNKNGIAASINYYTEVDDENNPTGNVGVYDLDDWMISPKMPLTGTLTFLARFDSLSDDYDEENDMLEVLVSTTADNLQMLYIDPSIFTAIGRIYPQNDNTFNSLTSFHRYSLDSYNGQEGYIAFRHKSAHKSMVYIDDVCVYRTTDAFTTLTTTGNNVSVTGLEPQTDYEFQVRSILYSTVSPWSELTTFTTEDYKSLAENDDNTQTITALANGQKHDVILQGHTFYRHCHEWNTLCVPFSVSDFSGTPLEGATVKAVSDLDFNDGTLTMNFTEATSIEAGRPYIVTWPNGVDLFITNESEWRRLAERVAGGEDFAGQNVVLMADIAPSGEYGWPMLGTAEHPFRGTFDGNGHTINLSINDAEYAAPFRYIDGATIRNLKVTGSVNGGSRCAGIVGAALGGTNSIRNCWMAASVTSSANIGGVLGHGTNSFTTISNCFLTGSLKGNSIGVFYGWGSANGVHAIENCLTDGSYDYQVDVDLLMSEGGTTSVTNCLKNRDYITQGTPNAAAHTYQFVTFLGNQWAEDESGNMVLKPTTDVEVNNIENPLFLGVTVSSDAPTSIDFSGGQFVGTYCPLADTSHTLMDANNPANGAFHAAICSDPSALGQGSINWYNDAALTSPATAIPFDADGHVTLYTGLWVELADATDNSGTIETIVSSGSQNNRVAVLKDRKLYRDGDWNTLCLPFSLNEAQIAASSIAGVTIMELDGTTSNLTNGTLTLNFKETFRIEAGRPYIVKWQHPTVVINSAADWESFAAAVNNGTSYVGKLVQLGADISPSGEQGGPMVGTAEHPFRGTFDGNGHTLNLSINDAEYAAPFRYIDGATIRNLKVTGSVNGGSHCAGIVGAALGGTNNIRDCWMAASVTSGGNMGGVLGHGTTSATTISNCFLTGSLKGNSIGVFYGGGYDGGVHAIENCWTEGSYDNQVDVYLLYSEGGTTSVTNCIKNRNDISQGSTSGAWYDSQKAFFLGSQWTTDNNGELVLKPSAEFDYTAINDPVFTGVTFDNSTAAQARQTVSFTGGSFRGSYDPVSLTPNDKSNLFLGAGNTLYWPNAANNTDGNYHLNACRAFFHIDDGNTVKAFVLNFGDEDETTGIAHEVEGSGFLDKPSGRAERKVQGEDSWFDLSGRRLSVPSASSVRSGLHRGIYINNGKKIVIK
ncbi:MAG: choice-of-anchor J domain-containing protein [Bacteroidaceae bacterium]|nr:choice-of-anchor J domain-containing protein [Bacteroidaceae bacterium]